MNNFQKMNLNNGMSKEEYAKFIKEKKFNNYYYSDIETLVKYVKENHPDKISEYEKEVAILEENKIRFIDNWDMERFSNIVEIGEPIDWSKQNFKDPEWTFMLCRMKHLSYITKCFIYTKDKKYLKILKKYLFDFIDNNHFEETKIETTWRTIDSGLRMSNIINALMILKSNEEFTHDDIQKIINSLYEHFNYLTTFYENWKILSNWGLLQLYPVLQFCILFPEVEGSEQKLKWALDKIKQSIEIQIYNDGSHWEQSPMYHNEVLDVCSKIYYLLKINNMSDFPFDENILRKIHYYNLSIIKPSLRQPLQGDSDNSLLVDKLQMGCCLLNDQYLKFNTGNILDENVLFNFGHKFIEIFNSIKEKEPDFKNVFLKDSGNFYYRSSWNKNANYLWFANGPLGSGHGHANMLHFDLTWKGTDFLIDSGRYSYREDEPIRVELKKSFSHNVPIVNDIQLPNFIGSWGGENFPHNFIEHSFENEKLTYIEGSYVINELSNGILNRKIIVIDDECVIVRDYFNNKNEITNFNQIFNLDEEVEIEMIDKNNIELNSNTNKLWITQFGNVSYEILKHKISKYYNELIDTKKIVFNNNNPSDGYTTVFSSEKTMILKSEVYQNGVKKMDDDSCEAFEIIGKNYHYIIYIAKRNIVEGKKIMFVNDIPFYGRVAIHDLKQKKTTIIK